MPSAFACQMSSTAFATGLPSSEVILPVTQTSSPFTVQPSRRSPPYSNSFAPCAKNGPSTVASVAPGTVLWLSATIIMERPRMSESRMNSWRLSSHFWPTAVRYLMPSNHSSSVRCTSRANAWRCLTAAVTSWRKRGSWAFWKRSTTAAVRVSSLNWRMGGLLGKAKCIIKFNPMRLVTFIVANAAPRAGALLDGDRKVLDLQAAYGRLYHGTSPVLDSVLAIVEAGEQALDTIGQLLRSPSPAVMHAREDVRLLAPIPVPPQMRDFLCFERHLVQAFQAIGRKPPAAWYERPVFYHPNRFSVCGPDAEVPWPAYTERLDFELEFGCYIGRPGKDIAKENARGHIFG